MRLFAYFTIFVFYKKRKGRQYDYRRPSIMKPLSENKLHIFKVMFPCKYRHLFEGHVIIGFK